MNSRRVYAKSHLTTWRAVTYSRTETSVSKTRRSFKDAGNVTEAKLSTSLLLLLNTRPRAPDLIRVDDDVRTTNERRTYDASRLRRRRNASLVRPSRVVLPAVTSPAGGRLYHAAAEGHAVLSSRPSASSSSTSSSPSSVAAALYLVVQQRAPRQLTWLLATAA